MRDNSPVFHTVILVLFFGLLSWAIVLSRPTSVDKPLHPGVQPVPARIIQVPLPVTEETPVDSSPVEPQAPEASPPDSSVGESWN